MKHEVLSKIEALDLNAVEAYNRGCGPEYALRLDMGPSPFEGDLERAPVVLLLANPGQGDVDDHRFEVPDWPLAALHDTAPPAMREWWRPRVRELAQHCDVADLSRRLAAIQLTPWASERFDSSLVLPSRPLQINLAERACRRGALLLVGRCARLWTQSALIRNHTNKLFASSPRCSYVSSRNYRRDNGWQRICEALERG